MDTEETNFHRDSGHHHCMRRKSVSAPNPLRCEIEGVTLRDLEFSAALGSLTGTLLFGGLRSVYKQMRNQRTQWALTREEMKNCVWLRPELVAQIEFTEWTPDGSKTFEVCWAERR